MIDLNDVDQLVVVQCFQAVSRSQLQSKIVFCVSNLLSLLQQAKISVNATDAGE